MRYDFDEIIDRRGTNSSKWDLDEELFGKEDLIDMWVADMDFPCPQPVIEALQARLEHPLFGYSFPPDSLYEAIIDWVERRYDWQIEREWILFTPGVVNGLYAAINTLTDHLGDEVVLQSPVYYPFFSSVENCGCQVKNNQLAYRNGNYSIDFGSLESMFATGTGFGAPSHRIKAFVLCSPHNPVGRVWKEGELERLVDICLENDCPIISDEIHCDLILDEDARHKPTATISDEAEKNTITLMSGSKTFNLAGLKAAFAIIPDPKWREDFARARAGEGGVNSLGLVAMEAALRHGEEYLEQLLSYLRENRDYFRSFLERELPQLNMVRLEGTYLAWVDMSGLGMNDRQLKEFMIEEVGVATDFGYVFGPGGEGFQRFNLACPRSRLKTALHRLAAAVDAL